MYNIGPNIVSRTNQPTDSNIAVFHANGEQYPTKKKNGIPNDLKRACASVVVSYCVRFRLSACGLCIFQQLLTRNDRIHTLTHTHTEWNLAPSVNWSYLNAAAEHYIPMLCTSTNCAFVWVPPRARVWVSVCLCVFGLHFH